MRDLDTRLRETLDRVADSTKVHVRIEEIVQVRRRRSMPRFAVGLAAFAAVVAVFAIPMLYAGSPDTTDFDAVVGTETTSSVAPSVPSDSTPSDTTTSPQLGDFEQVSLPPIGEAEFQTIAASADGVYAAVTVPNPDDWIVKVWRSADRGDTWEETLELVNDGLETDLIATEDELVLLMSDHVGDGGASVYRSTNDGEDWTRLELPMPEGAAGITSTTLVDGPDTLILGSAWNEVRDTVHEDGAVVESEYVDWRGVAWILDNGQILGPFDNPGIGIVSNSEFHGSRYYAVGAEPSADGQPAAWTSRDGISWSQVDLPQTPSEWVPGELETVTSSGEYLIALGELRSNSAEETRATAIYRTTDGQNWRVDVVEDRQFGRVMAVPGGFIASAFTGNTPEFATSTDGQAWDYQPADVWVVESSDSPTAQFLIGIDGESQMHLLRRPHD